MNDYDWHDKYLSNDGDEENDYKFLMKVLLVVLLIVLAIVLFT